MKVLLMIGNSPRHKKIAFELHKRDMLSALRIEVRESMLPEPPSVLHEAIEEFFTRYFRGRYIIVK